MRLDQLGVLTVGTLVPKEGAHTLPSTPCLAFFPGLGSHHSSLAPKGHHITAYPMQHVVNKALTRWVAAHLIRGHLFHGGNHRHGSAGHNQGRSSAPKAAEMYVLEPPNPIEGGS